MKENDSYGHYNAFVNELSRKSDQTLQAYCLENGVVWRRLYDCMRRHPISPKRLYQTYRTESKDSAAAACCPSGIGFRELIPGEAMVGQSDLSGDASVISGGDYDLDNNPIGRMQRLVSLLKRNSLFFGSHKGGETAAMYLSLVVSCRLNGINFMEYISDILNRCASWNPATPLENYRGLLPDRWNHAKPDKV